MYLKVYFVQYITFDSVVQEGKRDIDEMRDRYDYNDRLVKPALIWNPGRIMKGVRMQTRSRL